MLFAYIVTLMKTLVVALVWVAAHCFAVLPARATVIDLNAQARSFAVCAGRLSALVEHQWMFDGAGSEDTQLRRATFLELLDAVLPHLRDRGIDRHHVLHWRIEAKQAQAQLLRRATFGKPGRTMRQARMTSTQYIQHCNSLLLG